MAVKHPGRRKLLVATVGVAAVSYVALTEACGGKTDGSDGTSTSSSSSGSSSSTSGVVGGNLVAPTATPPISGNLPAPPPPVDASADAPTDGAVIRDASND